jgi:hypothetical protein
MKRSKKKLQYTIRAIPEELDRVLRDLARKTGKSLNEIAVDAMRKGSDAPTTPIHPDLHNFIGTWEDDPEFDKAMEDQRRIDPELWR